MDLPPLNPPCAIATEIRAWKAPVTTALPAPAPVPADSPADSPATGDYRHRLRPSPAGWARRSHWCVWVEPVQLSGPTAIWEQRWHQAVLDALRTWQAELPITLVSDPAQAQVLLQRRRPPILNGRASHGRALLQLLEVQRGGTWRLEPRVEVLISPGQAQPAIQATALHELGHAFGLWGHSDQAGDALAVKPAGPPVLTLSSRDQATMRWLQQQPALQQPDP